VIEAESLVWRLALAFAWLVVREIEPEVDVLLWSSDVVEPRDRG
jgi:hypothetical protein